MTERLAVIVGGQHTGRERLASVADAAVDIGLASDAAVYTLDRGMRNPDRLGIHLRNALVIAHSLGSLPVRRAVTQDTRPEWVVACNGPEPTPFGTMMHRTRAKFRQAKGDPALRSVIRHNVTQGLAHPIANTRYVSSMRRFSTLHTLREYQGMDTSVLHVATEDDVLTPYEPAANPAAIDDLILPGSHDEILVNSKVVLSAIAGKIK